MSGVIPNSSPSHWDLLNLDMDDNRIDIRSADEVVNVVQTVDPEIVFHLAAQPLVRRSYHDPLETWSTNVMGTATALEASLVTGVQRFLYASTIYVYSNYGSFYRASKQAAEIFIEENILQSHQAEIYS